MKIPKGYSINILVALVLGAFCGVFLPVIAPYVSWMGLAFKLSLSMIVMPIVLSSILAGLESIGDIRNLKDLGNRAIFYFIATTFFAVLLGLVIVTLIKPGQKNPSHEFSELVASINDMSNTDAALLLAIKIKEKFSLKEDDQRFLNINKNLEDIALKALSLSDFKKQVSYFIGALELRFKLEPDMIITPTKAMSLAKFIDEQLKSALKNPFEALASQDVLAVIVFTILFGAAMTTIGPLGNKFFEINRAINMAIIKIIELIMRFAPFGVFGLLVNVVSSTGPEVFQELSFYALSVLIGLFLHLFIFLPGINYFFTKQSPKEFLLKIRPAMAIAFSTSSSSASLPITMQCVEDGLKVDRRISQFILPLGATVNMNGTALYEAVAAVFIAQLYGISLDMTAQIVIALTSVLAAIGTAGIPAAGTVSMALILSAAGLPIEGVGLLFVLDRPLDMCRTVVNVAGDACGCNILNAYYKKHALYSEAG